jgi:hypothetical protein
MITNIAPAPEPDVLAGCVLLDDGRNLGSGLVGFGVARRETTACWKESPGATGKAGACRSLMTAVNHWFWKALPVLRWPDSWHGRRVR